jgi:hypothetical protein
VTFYEYRKPPFKEGVIHAVLNRNVHDAAHQEAMPNNCESCTLLFLDNKESTTTTTELRRPMLSVDEWHNLNINVVVEYEKYRKKNSNVNMHDFLRILNHNLGVIDSLNNGDIIKLEGTKVLDIVLYHHAAIMLGKLTFFCCFFLSKIIQIVL